MHAHVPSCCSSSLSQCPYLSEVITWRRCVCALLCACPCLHLHVYTSLPQVCICIWMNNILRVYECAICWFIHVFSQGKLEAWNRRFTLLLARLYCHSASLCRVCTRMLQLWFLMWTSWVTIPLQVKVHHHYWFYQSHTAELWSIFPGRTCQYYTGWTHPLHTVRSSLI